MKDQHVPINTRQETILNGFLRARTTLTMVANVLTNISIEAERFEGIQTIPMHGIFPLVPST
mgnify:CR=1 FL=1